jgi:hypothetical protein
MATSLRTLLDRGSSDTLQSGPQPAYLEGNYESMMFINRCSQSYDDSYGKGCFCPWRLDASEYVTMEVWGGGGGGAGSSDCGCNFGWPGGSGAYAKKTFTEAEIASASGTCYCMCVAPSSCCSPNMSCGYKGCRSYIVGSGLSNFCADGGEPGCTQFCMTGCGGNWTGMCPHPCFSNCACYYDCTDATVTGVPGRHGYVYTDFHCNSNWCYYSTIFPGPPMDGNNDTIYYKVRFCGNVEPSHDVCKANGIFQNGFRGGSVSKSVGVGGNSTRVCGDGCCCGWGGGPGLIRINWR